MKIKGVLGASMTGPRFEDFAISIVKEDAVE